MPVKAIEVIAASSEKGVAVAIQNVLAEVERTIRNNDSVFAKDIKIDTIQSQVSTNAVICKIFFRPDEDETEK